MYNERGIGIVEILVVLIVAGIIAGASVPSILRNKEEARQRTIDSERALLKAKCSVYYLDTGEHAVKPTDMTEVMDKDTNKFVNWINDKLGFPVGDFTEYNKRFKWIDTQKLIDKKLLDSHPTDNRYVLDILTYQVYHVTDGKDVLEYLVTTSNGSTATLDKLSIRRFPIETGSVYMSEVNSAILVGNIIYVGGTGTMKLAKIEVTATTQTVSDITDKLVSPQEVYSVSSVGSGLKIEYLTTTGETKIVTVAF